MCELLLLTVLLALPVVLGVVVFSLLSARVGMAMAAAGIVGAFGLLAECFGLIRGIARVFERDSRDARG